MVRSSGLHNRRLVYLVHCYLAHRLYWVRAQLLLKGQSEVVRGRVEPERFMGLSGDQTVVRSSNLCKTRLVLIVHYSARWKCGVQARLLLQDQSDDVGGRVDMGRLVRLAGDPSMIKRLERINH